MLSRRSLLTIAAPALVLTPGRLMRVKRLPDSMSVLDDMLWTNKSHEQILVDIEYMLKAVWESAALPLTTFNVANRGETLQHA
jgi:hypothetical protein